MADDKKTTDPQEKPEPEIVTPSQGVAGPGVGGVGGVVVITKDPEYQLWKPPTPEQDAQLIVTELRSNPNLIVEFEHPSLDYLSKVRDITKQKLPPQVWLTIHWIWVDLKNNSKEYRMIPKGDGAGWKD